MKLLVQHKTGRGMALRDGIRSYAHRKNKIHRFMLPFAVSPENLRQSIVSLVKRVNDKQLLLA